jgi:cytoskeletal protein CcmA (bactofilin family)
MMQTKTTDPAPQTSPRAPAGKSVLSGDLKITGDITSGGSVEVFGEIDGTLSARTLLIGAEGRMNGTVSAETVEVRGRLDGRISCSTLTLRAAASVTADVSYRVLVIESGAQIDGRFKHVKD